MPKSKACLRSKKQDAHNPVPYPCPKKGKSVNDTAISPVPEGRIKNVKLLAESKAVQGHKIQVTLDDKVLNIRKAISLLFLLTKAPAGLPAKDHETSPPYETERRRSPLLSFDLEVNLVEVFTFLASTTNDPYKVAALSLESQIEAGRTVYWLKIAANHGELESTKHGLERIFRIVRRDPAQERLKRLGSSLDDERSDRTTSKFDTVLHSVLVMHCNRLLCRLRSRHAQWKCNFKKAKMSRRPVVRTMFSMYDKQQRQRQALPVFHKDMNLLRSSFSSLESLSHFDVKGPPASVITNLEYVVKIVHRLWQQDEFRASVDGQPFALPLAKIARYISATMFLVDNEEVRSVLESLTVQIVKMSPVVTTRLEPGTNSLTKFAAELSMPEVPTQLLSRQLHTDQTGPSSISDENFLELVNSKCAVHAEIQLLFDYELHGYRGNSRIINSTKRPCFSCALFVAIHGRFHMPTSHGRLYEKWTFPDGLRQLTGSTLEHMNTVMSQYLDALSACIVQALLHQPCRKMTSMESFFRHSSIWTGTSRAVVLQDLDGHRPKSATTMRPNEVRSEVGKFTHFRSSTTALVYSFVNLIRLCRGECTVFQLGVHSTPETTVKTKTMSLLFAQEDDIECRKVKHDMAHHLFVKVHSLDVYGSTARSLQHALRQVVAIDGLSPGEEIVVQQADPGSDGFLVVHKDECLYVQVQKGFQT